MRTEFFILRTALFFCLLVLSSFFVIAATEYTEMGGDNSPQFDLDDAIFDDNNEEFELTVIPEALSSLLGSPLVADLDGDGTNEIVVFDDNDVKLLHITPSGLDVIIGFERASNDRISNVLLFDIDADGLIEIIFTEEVGANNFYILEYNGTAFTNQTTQLLTITHTSGARQEISCESADKCIIISQQRNDPAGTSSIVAVPFDSTGTIDTGGITIATENNNQRVFCLPNIGSIFSGEVDQQDENDEWVVTAVEAKNGADVLRIFRLSSNGTQITEEADEGTSTFGIVPLAFIDVDDNAGLPDCLVDNIGFHFTNALVGEFEGGSQGLEIVVAAQVENDEFKMGVFDRSGSLIDDHPEIVTASGAIVSNPFKADIFFDTEDEDYCVLGHDNSVGGTNSLNLLCGSQETGGFFQEGSAFSTFTFRYDLSLADFNITETDGRVQMLSHSGQNQDTKTNIGDTQGSPSNKNADEIITSWGVFRVTNTQINESLTFLKQMEKIFDNPIDDTTCIMADVRKDSTNDMICVSAANLYYFDDGLQNDPAFITDESEFDPCLDQGTVKQNTTLTVKVFIEDNNNNVFAPDNVFSNVTFYEGDSNEFTSPTVNMTTDVDPHFHTGNLNKSGVNFNVLIRAWDAANPTIIDIQEQTYQVGTNGLEAGDCTQPFGTDPDSLVPGGSPGDPVPEINTSLILDLDDNAITNIVDELAKATGLGRTLWWLVGMFIFFALVLFFPSPEGIRESFHERLIAASVGEALLLIIGVFLGFIPISLVIVFVILAAIPLGFWIRNLITT